MSHLHEVVLTVNEIDWIIYATERLAALDMGVHSSDTIAHRPELRPSTIFQHTHTHTKKVWQQLILKTDEKMNILGILFFNLFTRELEHHLR